MADSGMGTSRPQPPIRVAVAGNPNSGKTTIFNQLTGARQHVANYPGVTVEAKVGHLRYQGREIELVDLPGTYSLTAYSAEELIARNFVIEQQPDMVLDVVDASNLERNLYLATQFMELRVPLILAFNMSDMAEARGVVIDVELLSRLLGVTVVRTVGHKGAGMQELKDAIVRVADALGGKKPATVRYGAEIERELASVAGRLEQEPGLVGRFDARWLALKLLEGDEEVRREIEQRASDPAAVLSAVESAAHRIERDFGDPPEIAIADQRYGFISGACREAVRITVEDRRTLSDQIDSVVTSRVLGFPIFLGLMYLVFRLAFTIGEPWTRAIEWVLVRLGEAVGSVWPAGAGATLRSLIVDGVIGGVGGVLVFLPNILLLFLAIAVLEDSGYMARAAFIMDKLMHKIGLHGKSFIPMLIGFGCTVPAVMATRTLESRRDRLTTMLVLPLMSCSARLTIYTLFLSAFFAPQWRAPLLWTIYLAGIVLAIGLARVLRSTIFRGEMAPFVMELPPYRMPTLRGTLIHMWDRGWAFVRKAGTVILAASVLLWAMSTYPRPPAVKVEGMDQAQARSFELSYSMAGRIGHGVEPVMRLVGFDWRASTALLGAMGAKEVFVAQLGIMHALGSDAGSPQPLSEVLQRQYTPLQAFCIMLFCLVSIPCVATLVATWRESGSWKWAALQWGGLTAIAYAVTFVVYRAGTLLHVGVT